jgi:hypothetical protein
MAGFAGSRSLDERRRRRLATESDTVAFEAVADPSPPRRTSAAKLKRIRRGPAHFPLRKVISIRYWKLAAVILCITLAGAGILTGGWAAATHGEQLGPGFVLLFRLDAARLVRGFAAVGLLLAGELALLIGWARSQSLQDFNGRYRGWVFCGVLGFVAALGLETQLAAAWGATAAWLWPTPFSYKASLLWLAPTALCGLLVLTYLVREMRDCRLSLTFAWLAAVLGCAASATVLSRPLPLPMVHARLVECSIALLFVVCAFSSLLFHARHVVYVCVDPPAIRPSRLTAALRGFRPWTILRFKRSSSKKPRKSSEGGTVTTLKRRTPKRPRTLRRPPNPAEPQPPSEDAESPTRPNERAKAADRVELRSGAPNPARSRVSASTINSGKTPAPMTRSAAAPDAKGSSSQGDKRSGPFEGMSRRERRLLKKEMRAERAPLRKSA